MKQFDDGWRFGRADDAFSPGFDDSAWRTIDLPHDWSIEDLPLDSESPRRTGPFDPDVSGGKGATGYFVGGVGWYRKRFSLSGAERAEVRFEGAYCISDVWLNGHHLGSHVHGYTPFCFDLTPFLHHDRENVLAVRVKNEGANSRWYTGSGLYRHVWLKTSGAVFIPMDGVFITTPEGGKAWAEVRVAVEVQNSFETDATGDVDVEMTDPSGTRAATLTSQFHLGPGSSTVLELKGRVANPQLWELEAPNLYIAHVTVATDGRQSDSEKASFGIRQVRFTPEEGFLLNGRSVKIKGGCVHHDNGLLGAAAIDRAEVRRIELLKDAGFNGVRTSHNAPSTAFLNACDRLGLVVMDEAFDDWHAPKTPDSYSNHFEETSEAVLTAQIRRDRNHPSVVMWSIGNEIPEQFAKPETALRLRNRVLASDPTRAISQGICASFWAGFQWVDWQTSSDPGFLHLDVGGYNYQHANYEPDHLRHPERIMAGTESFPKDIFDVWTLVEKHPWLIGDFTWTALDYFGESGIGRIKFESMEGKSDEFPLHMAICGDLDILGHRKPPSYYRQAQWQNGILYAAVGQEPDADTVFDSLPESDWRPKWGWPNVCSHWTYPGEEGQVKQVFVYSSCDSVKLSLNGKPLGEKPTGQDERRIAKFDVPYEPGELRVVGLVEGREVEFVLKTAGPPAALQLTFDRLRLTADRNDLGYVTIEVVDAAGVVVPNADSDVEVTVTGPAELAAFGNADPLDPSSVRSNRHRAWNGVLQAIIRPIGVTGIVRVRAEAEPLKPCEQEVEIVISAELH